MQERAAKTETNSPVKEEKQTSSRQLYRKMTPHSYEVMSNREYDRYYFRD